MRRSEREGAGRCGNAVSRRILCLLVGLLWTSRLNAQSPEEHASHHPGQAPQPTSTPAGAMGGSLAAATQPAQASTPCEQASACGSPVHLDLPVRLGHGGELGPRWEFDNRARTGAGSV